MSLAWSSVKALSIPVGGTARDVKRISVGGVTLWEKPNPLPYDAEVEYIESTGTQYIDTGLKYTTGLSVSMRFAFATGASNGWFFGFRYMTGGYDYSWALFGPGGAGVQIGTSWKGFSAFSSSTWYDVLMERYAVTINGTKYTQTTSASVPSGIPPIMVFGRVYNTSMANLAKCLVSSFKVYDSGTLVRDYIPVRVGSGANAVGCLYDKLGTGGQNPDGSARNDGLYFRQGTGAFVVGPDRNA